MLLYLLNKGTVYYCLRSGRAEGEGVGFFAIALSQHALEFEIRIPCVSYLYWPTKENTFYIRVERKPYNICFPCVSYLYWPTKENIFYSS